MQTNNVQHCKHSIKSFNSEQKQYSANFCTVFAWVCIISVEMIFLEPYFHYHIDTPAYDIFKIA